MEAEDYRQIIHDEEVVSRLAAVLAAGGTATLRVTGNSMVPFLHHLRDYVELRAVEPKQLRRGDIVFFQRKNGSFVLHRIYRVRKGKLTINGDGQTWTEEIEPSQVIGKTVAVHRSGGKVASCAGFWWRLCSAIWRQTRAIRPAIFRFVGRCRRMWRKIA